MRRRTRAALFVAMVGASVLASSASRASTAQEADFVSRINAERSSRGIATVLVRSDLTTVARDWSEHMAEAGSISHDPDLPNKISGWTALGDNVGKGPSVSTIHEAFMDSDTHRAIMLDPDFNQVGVGVVQAGNTLYVTEIFARRISAPVHAPAPALKPKSWTPAPAVGSGPSRTVPLTARIWGVDLTASPVTVDVLIQLLELDAS